MSSFLYVLPTYTSYYKNKLMYIHSSGVDTYICLATKEALHDITNLTWRCYRRQFSRFYSFKGSITTDMIKCNQNVMS